VGAKDLGLHRGIGCPNARLVRLAALTSGLRDLSFAQRKVGYVNSGLGE
jgi:hypothetical protein